MLNRVAHILLRTPSLIGRLPRIQFLSSPKYSFSNGELEQRAQALKKLLNDQIQYEQSNKADLTQQLNYFKSNSWTINHNGPQVELSKQSGPYQLKVLFNARTPLSEEEQPQQGSEEQQQPNEDYAQVAAFISKDGSKWLCAEFMVVNNQCHLSVANFIKSYETEKAERLKNRLSTATYQGPELGSLESGLMDSITEFLESVGIDNTLLVQTADYSVAYEHKFYVQWLKNFESIC